MEEAQLGEGSHLCESLEGCFPRAGDLAAVGGTRHVSRAQARVVVGGADDGVEVRFAKWFGVAGHWMRLPEQERVPRREVQGLRVVDQGLRIEVLKSTSGG